MTTNVMAQTAAYLQAVGDKQFDRLNDFLHSQVEFITGGRTLPGVGPYIAALRKLGPILLRYDVKRIFVDGDEACAIYDFVTDTSVGAVPSVEWLKFENGRIRSSQLIFHTQPWPVVLEELARRTKS